MMTTNPFLSFLGDKTPELRYQIQSKKIHQIELNSEAYRRHENLHTVTLIKRRLSSISMRYDD